MDKIKYIINEKNQEVIAIAKNCKDDAISKIRKLDYEKLFDFFFYFNKKEIKLPNTIKARVKVRDDDVFDVETGKALAKKKLLNKHTSMIHKRIKKFINIINNKVSYMNEYIKNEKNKYNL